MKVGDLVTTDVPIRVKIDDQEPVTLSSFVVVKESPTVIVSVGHPVYLMGNQIPRLTHVGVVSDHILEQCMQIMPEIEQAIEAIKLQQERS